MDDHSTGLSGVDPARLAAFRAAEVAAFDAAHPVSKAAQAPEFLGGVPMHWMSDWPTPFPLLVREAKRAVLRDVDGHEVDDFCLGDTGSMFGHSPAPVARALKAQAARGLTYMLPTEAALAAGKALTETFGDFLWQIATTATDANRFALRVARAVTGKPKVLVFNGCYHGTVDDAMVVLDQGRTVNRLGLVGQVTDISTLAVSVEFNDLSGVEAALAQGDVAAVLTEPVMTNSCMVLPEPGFLQGLRDLTRRDGALLMIDETHTQSSGHGGYTRVHGLDPDMFIVGKCVAGGLPTAVWGMRAAVAERFAAYNETRPAGHSGMGTTLSANPLQFAALLATLREVATPKAFAKMEKGAAWLAKGLSAAITEAQAPWHVLRVGARVEFICAPGPLKNGTEAARAHAHSAEAAVHLGLLNRGSLIAPFHNMMLVSPVTTNAQIDRLIANFRTVLAVLFPKD